MNENELVNKITELTDEKNYLRNILERAEETGDTIDSIIQDRIENIYNQLAILEEDMPF